MGGDTACCQAGALRSHHLLPPGLYQVKLHPSASASRKTARLASPHLHVEATGEQLLDIWALDLSTCDPGG